MTGWEMQGIFISYRRQDSQSAAGRLADHIKEQMPGVPVFRDVETIEPGMDFVEAISRALESCGVLLAVIGPHWSSVADAGGRRRLENANDYTRLEIATAFQRPNVRVIPVLVEGAQIPDANDLPEDLQALCRRNAIELTDKRWNYDVSQLIETLRKALGVEPPPPKPGPQPEPRPESPPSPQAWYRRLTKKQWGIGAAIVVVLGILGERGQNGMNATQSPHPCLPTPLCRQRRSFRALWQATTRCRRRPLPLHRTGRPGEVRRHEPTRPGVWSRRDCQQHSDPELHPQWRYRVYPELEISPDGSWRRGRYGSAVTGESGMVVLRRTP